MEPITENIQDEGGRVDDAEMKDEDEEEGSKNC